MLIVSYFRHEMIRSGYYDFSEPLYRRNLCRMKNVDGHLAVISTGFFSRDKLSTRVHWLLLWGSFTELNILKHFDALGCDWQYSHLWTFPFEWEVCEAHLFLSVCVEKGYGKICMQLVCCQRTSFFCEVYGGAVGTISSLFQYFTWVIDIWRNFFHSSGHGER
jgi:hypothetical protein